MGAAEKRRRGGNGNDDVDVDEMDGCFGGDKMGNELNWDIKLGM